MSSRDQLSLYSDNELLTNPLNRRPSVLSQDHVDPAERYLQQIQTNQDTRIVRRGKLKFVLPQEPAYKRYKPQPTYKRYANRKKVNILELPNTFFSTHTAHAAETNSESTSRQSFIDVFSEPQAGSDSNSGQIFKFESFLDYESLRHLRRDLTPDMVEFELNGTRKRALQEAIKTVPKFKSDCNELVELKKEMKLPSMDVKFILSLPRMFRRSSARFELPMDSRTLTDMTPIQYLKENVYINSTRKMLFNCIFKLFRSSKVIDVDGNETKEGDENKVLGNKIPDALGVVMGEKLTPKQLHFLQKLILWYDNEEYDFKTFCNISAFCERVLAHEFSSIADKKGDPCQDVERLDFETLEKKLRDQNVNKKLAQMLRLIKEC